MSEMLIGVLRMPPELFWSDDEMTRLQHDNIRREAADEIDRLQAECEKLKAGETSVREALDGYDNHAEPAHEIVKSIRHRHDSYVDKICDLKEENERLKALLLQSAPIIHAHARASHMLEGFKPKRNKWDALVEQIDAAIATNAKANGELP